MKINVPASVGELFDKITILEIKKKKIKDKEKLKHVNAELNLLNKVVTKKKINKRKILKLINALKSINLKLWNVEDKLRKLEKEKSFKSLFIQKARSVYILNDKRSVMKNNINIETNSNVNEVKSYEKY
tara:strand:- start:784 stop:1170 length:387 start_codon:yes stop_codon:yes gene_type:complete